MGVTWLWMTAIVAQPADAEHRLPIRTDTAAVRPDASKPAVYRFETTPLITDVVLGPQGNLPGRVVLTREIQSYRATAGWSVMLLGNRQPIAESVTDDHGTFAFRNLSGGLYEVVLKTPRGPSRRLYRVWSTSRAPPSSAEEVQIPVEESVVRAQSPFPIMSPMQAATMTAIVGGAIAAPAIYNNAQVANRIPASP